MNGKITRRQLAGVATGSAVVAMGVFKTVAQAPTPSDFDKAARESHRENSETLGKFEIPMSLEPAFQFKA